MMVLLLAYHFITGICNGFGHDCLFGRAGNDRLLLGQIHLNACYSGHTFERFFNPHFAVHACHSFNFQNRITHLILLLIRIRRPRTEDLMTTLFNQFKDSLHEFIHHFPVAGLKLLGDAGFHVLFEQHLGRPVQSGID